MKLIYYTCTSLVINIACSVYCLDVEYHLFDPEISSWYGSRGSVEIFLIKNNCARMGGQFGQEFEIERKDYPCAVRALTGLYQQLDQMWKSKLTDRRKLFLNYLEKAIGFYDRKNEFPADPFPSRSVSAVSTVPVPVSQLVDTEYTKREKESKNYTPAEYPSVKTGEQMLREKIMHSIQNFLIKNNCARMGGQFGQEFEIERKDYLCAVQVLQAEYEKLSQDSHNNMDNENRLYLQILKEYIAFYGGALGNRVFVERNTLVPAAPVAVSGGGGGASGSSSKRKKRGKGSKGKTKRKGGRRKKR